MSKLTKIVCIGVLLAAAIVATVALAANPYVKIETQDTGPAVICANSHTSAVVIAVTGSGTGVTVTVDGNANTWVADVNYTNLAEFASVIEASTNAAGTAAITVNTEPGLTTDIVSNNVLTGSYTSPASGSVEIPWDTSGCGFFSVYGEATYQPLQITSIFGNPGGTGSVTLAVYDEQTLIWQTVLPEIMYSYTDPGGTNRLLNTTEVNLPVDPGIIIPLSHSFFIRATRGTVAEEGTLGYTVRSLWQ